MTKLKPLLWLALFGSLWGFAELVGGEILYRADAPLASVWLAAWAFFILSTARGIHGHMGSSTLVAIVAVLFRSVNTTPFFCHLLGIFLLGLTFDLVSSFFLKGEFQGKLQKSLAGVFSAYAGYASFALIVTYIVRHEFWIGEGLPKVLNHVLLGGSLAALLASVVVPIGFNIGKKGEEFVFTRPKWAFALGFLLLCTLWSFKIIAG